MPPASSRTAAALSSAGSCLQSTSASAPPPARSTGPTPEGSCRTRSCRWRPHRRCSCSTSPLRRSAAAGGLDSSPARCATRYCSGQASTPSPSTSGRSPSSARSPAWWREMRAAASSQTGKACCSSSPASSPPASLGPSSSRRRPRASSGGTWTVGRHRAAGGTGCKTRPSLSQAAMVGWTTTTASIRGGGRACSAFRETIFVTGCS
mmetsp:Transcript_6475/g.21229  ORF Transcript_6475/g.21229 Transcript_6475/m.21229 type:complete len:207 (-) Transcript_6475:190-810(-)